MILLGLRYVRLALLEVTVGCSVVIARFAAAEAEP